MLILGATSDTAKAFVEYFQKKGDRYDVLYLSGSNEQKLQSLAQHYWAKFQQKCEVIPIDFALESGVDKIRSINISLVFCTTGFLGKPTENGIEDLVDVQKIININYSNLVVLLSFLAKKLENQRRGGIIIFSSVAGERGRKSNFVYGSAKAGITAFSSGLRAYLSDFDVHVLTVKPGFMNTSMTEGLNLPKPLTAEPHEVAKAVYEAYNKKKNVLYVYPIWKYIMLIIKLIPEFIFKKLPL